MKATLLVLVLGLVACGKKEDSGKPKAAPVAAVTLAPTPTPVATPVGEFDPAWTRAVMEPQIYACMAAVDTHIEAMWAEKPKDTFSPFTVYGELAKRGEETRCRDYALSDEDEDL